MFNHLHNQEQLLTPEAPQAPRPGHIFPTPGPSPACVQDGGFVFWGYRVSGVTQPASRLLKLILEEEMWGGGENTDWLFL